MSIPLFAYYYLVHNFELLWYIPSSRMWDNNNRTLKFSLEWSSKSNQIRNDEFFKNFIEYDQLNVKGSTKGQ